MTAHRERVDELVARLSLDEKAALSLGSDGWHTAPLPAHGVGRVKVTDGPTGARGDGASGATATCFPVGVAVGATWDTDLVAELAAALADEARTKGAHVLLGPTINLQRTPIGGRNFECYSEDPWLTGRLAVAFVGALQEAGVGACVKHLVGNDVEFDRHEVSADMDEATLREVALLPFELVVREARPWSIMAAYNRLNGETCTANRHLLTDILKREWGWDGVVISDWGAVKDTEATLGAGCDLEMPGPAGHLGSAAATAVRSGAVPEERLDDLARRLLLLAARAGRLDDAEEPRERSVDDEGRRALARRAAAAGFVLLRNDGTLPLVRSGLRRVAMVGPNVEGFMIQGGGSSQVRPHSSVVGPLEALRRALGPEVEVVHEPGCTNHKFAPLIPDERWEGAAPEVVGVRPAAGMLTFARRRDDGPVLVELFDNLDFDGEPAWSYRADGVSTGWFGRIRRLPDGRFSGRLTARYVPEATGRHEFGLSAVGRSRLYVGGGLVVDNWTDPRPGETFFANGTEEARGEVDLQAGVAVEVVIELRKENAAEMAGVRLGVAPPQPPDLLERAAAAAASADVAVVVVGTTSEWETEGHDRRDFALPGRQADLIRAVAVANPRTVVIVNAGSPVEMAWVDGVGAALQVWFGGEEMGPALADVLLGDAEPGGRLPHTIPRALEDHPAASAYPARDGHLPYEEGLRCGHRWYDDRGIEPRFPFGHGLSYARCTWGAATVDTATLDVDAPRCTVTVPVTNTDDRDGTEVVQAYLSSPTPGRPPRVLVAFRKVHVPARSTVDVRLDLDGDAFRRWDDGAGGWTTDAGTYTVSCGASSRDLRSAVELTLA